MFIVNFRTIFFTLTLTFNCVLMGYASNPPSKLNEMINQIHPKDAVSYSFLKNIPGFREKIQESYHGIDDEVKLDQLLQTQSYIEVLNHLWSETDSKKRLSWLEKKISLGHPILMFELGMEYLANSPNLETYVYKAQPWIKAGCLRTEVDSRCFLDKGDQSVDVVSLLLFAYDPSFIISQFSNEEEMRDYCNQHKEEVLKVHKRIILQTMEPFLTLETANKMPAPTWLNPTADAKANEWFKVRKEAVENVLKEIEITDTSK
jgi:hypothetical protein